MLWLKRAPEEGAGVVAMSFETCTRAFERSQTHGQRIN